MLDFNGGNLDQSSGAAITTSTYNPSMQWDANFTFFGSNGANSDLNLGTGSVLLTGSRTVTIHNDATLTVGGAISGGANGYGLTKDGTGTLVLVGANTYGGDTTVNGGTLAVSGNSIANTNKLVIDGGKVDVAAAANEVVDTLYFGTNQQPAGTYGSTSSSATHQDDSRFSGSGTVTVTTGTGGYVSWAHAYAGEGVPNEDYNNDGVANGVAYFMGMDGLAACQCGHLLRSAGVRQPHRLVACRRRRCRHDDRSDQGGFHPANRPRHHDEILPPARRAVRSGIEDRG